MSKKNKKKKRNYTTRQIKLTEVLRARTQSKKGSTDWIGNLPELPAIDGEKKSAVVISKK